jgi:hypothetical protein
MKKILILFFTGLSPPISVIVLLYAGRFPFTHYPTKREENFKNKTKGGKF